MKLTGPQEHTLRDLAKVECSTTTLGSWRTTDALMRHKLIRKNGNWYSITAKGKATLEAQDRRALAKVTA